MRTILSKLVILLTVLLLHSCGVYDLQTKHIKENGIFDADSTKGRMLLEKTWKKQGYDKLRNFNTYSYHGSDTWRGLLGGMSKIWPEKKSELSFKYIPGSFDGQVTFLDGKQKGNSAGLQNWKYYEITNQKTTFRDKDAKKSKRKVFGIAAFQYFTEMIDRLLNAPIVSYAGEEEFRGQAYDLVFCTWDVKEPHLEHDQYMLWINKKTGFLDFAQYTIRESYIKFPGYKAIGGGVEHANYKNIDGVMIPHEQIVYPFNIKKKQKKNLHRLIISDFEFNAFEAEELRVNKSLKSSGDYKN